MFFHLLNTIVISLQLHLARAQRLLSGLTINCISVTCLRTTHESKWPVATTIDEAKQVHVWFHTNATVHQQV